jgi:alpha-methylacyl-CoA racemase
MPKAQGPLAGIKIVELVGIGPGPFACMLLADLGADVIRVDRAQNVAGGDPESPPLDLLARGRRSIGVDLKSPAGVETVLKLVDQADVLIEGFRPGVMERLGLGPDVCAKRNPKLVYGRMTGWGQEGPLASAAGHDINYISLTGALHTIGRHGEAPVPPLNLVGDFGGGTMYLIMGVLAALVERQSSGKGQVVDAAMTDGSASLMTIFYGLMHLGFWKDERGTNMLDTGAHFYDVYETKDGKYVSIGSIEPQFYALLLKHTGLAGETLPAQFDREQWPALKEKVAGIIRTKTRDEWCAIMENTDVCFAPVLSMREAPSHPHNVARGTFTEMKGVVQPAPAPRFSRTPGAIQCPPAHPGQHTDEALADWGFSAAEIAKLRASNAIA